MNDTQACHPLRLKRVLLVLRQLKRPCHSLADKGSKSHPLSLSDGEVLDDLDPLMLVSSEPGCRVGLASPGVPGFD